ncbi:MAG: hypothetical protein WDW38_002834 [Sanguina aurantia]
MEPPAVHPIPSLEAKVQKGASAATTGSSLKKLFSKLNPLTHGPHAPDAGGASNPATQGGQGAHRRAGGEDMPVSRSSRIDPTSVSFQEATQELSSATLHGPLPGVKHNDHAPRIMERFLSDLAHADCSPTQFDESPPHPARETTADRSGGGGGGGGDGNDVRTAVQGNGSLRGGPSEAHGGAGECVSDHELAGLKPDSQADSDESAKGFEKDANLPSRSSPGGRWGSLVAAAALSLLLHSTVMVEGASAARASPPAKRRKEKSVEEEINDFTALLWGIAGPVLSNLGSSGVLGVAGGMAVKKLGQVLAVVLGAIFISLQGLVYLNLITVNWVKVNATMLAYFDVDKNGKVDENDFRTLVSRSVGALSAGVPSVGGFLAGFMIGLRL